MIGVGLKNWSAHPYQNYPQVTSHLRCYYQIYTLFAKGIKVEHTVNLENFVRILFLRIALKDILAILKNSLLGHDLALSTNDRVILSFFEDFNFSKLRICEVSQK